MDKSKIERTTHSVFLSTWNNINVLYAAAKSPFDSERLQKIAENWVFDEIGKNNFTPPLVSVGDAVTAEDMKCDPQYIIKTQRTSCSVFKKETGWFVKYAKVMSFEYHRTYINDEKPAKPITLLDEIREYKFDN